MCRCDREVDVVDEVGVPMVVAHVVQDSNHGWGRPCLNIHIHISTIPHRHSSEYPVCSLLPPSPVHTRKAQSSHTESAIYDIYLCSQESLNPVRPLPSALYPLPSTLNPLAFAPLDTLHSLRCADTRQSRVALTFPSFLNNSIALEAKSHVPTS